MRSYLASATLRVSVLLIFASLSSFACREPPNTTTPENAKQFLKLRGYQFDEQSFVSAVRRSDALAVNAFLAAGINPETKDEGRGATVLILAAARGDASIVKALLDRGADVNAIAPDGGNALLRALEKKYEPVADLLLARPELNLNTQSGEGKTALMNYVYRENEPLVEQLLDRGANANLQDNDGDTALHRASQNGNVRIAQLLLGKGADPNLKNKLGGTPLMWAAVFGRDEVVELLLSKGADPRLKDEDGVKAAEWALQNKHDELAKHLRDAELKR